jgi:hypothetical protein
LDQQANQSEQVEVKQSKYIFPNFIAGMMSNTSPKVQYESSMMGTFLLILSIFLTTIYYIGFSEMLWYFKAFIIFNAIAGFLMLSSMLVTTYQQYNQYMQAVQLEKMISGNDISIQPFNPTKVKRVRYISAAIESILLVIVSWFFNIWWLLILLIHPLYLAVTTNRFITKNKLKLESNV